jgi:energy-coupling factor transporter ATP-binding protein EcfA2
MTGTMQLDEKRVPQDGRIQMSYNDKEIDMRVSIIPTNNGESVVMRVLDKSSLRLGLVDLGFLSDDQATFEQLITLPDGIILVTGPTGSGKTTTLYACLNFINRPDRKIITVEDPVEYELAGINQVMVKEDVGMTFAAALRAMLRQAPNIIMLGEIRDLETASIAIQASLTGHLVFSTLHTNDAPSAVARLSDIGVKPFLIASAVRAIEAQRLVRKLCGDCKTSTSLSDRELRALGLEASQVYEATIMGPNGCSKCRQLGYPRSYVPRGDLQGGRRSAQHDQPAAHHAAASQTRPRTGHAHPARGRHSQGARRHDDRRGGHRSHHVRLRLILHLTFSNDFHFLQTTMTVQNVVDMLENRGVIDKGLAYDIDRTAVHNGKDILQTLLDYGIYTNEDEFWAHVADELGAEHFDLAIRAAAVRRESHPAGMARLYGCFPITLDGQGLHVAFTDPLNPQLAEDLRFGLGKDHRAQSSHAAARCRHSSTSTTAAVPRASTRFLASSARRQRCRVPSRGQLRPHREIRRSRDASGHQGTCERHPL